MDSSDRERAVGEFPTRNHSFLSAIHRLFKTSGNMIVQSSAMKRGGIRFVHSLPPGFLNSHALH